jgi:hypothetical protein
MAVSTRGVRARGAASATLLPGARVFKDGAVVRSWALRTLNRDTLGLTLICTADRFQSMAQVRDALVAATSGVGSPGAAAYGAPTVPTQSSPAERTPSIAVLPFANMGGDKETEYFSDGLGEEAINVLARIPDLKVIARTSAFAFRGKELDIRKIAEMLGVRTILEGSVRRAGSRIRIFAQ